MSAQAEYEAQVDHYMREIFVVRARNGHPLTDEEWAHRKASRIHQASFALLRDEVKQLMELDW